MTAYDFDRTARAWLQDGPVVMSDRAVQAALDEVHLTRQRRPLWTTWRNAPVNPNLVRLAATAAAVVLVAVIGVNLLPGGNPPGGQPTNSPNVTTSPASSLTAEPSAVARAVDITYDPYPFRLSLTLPAGWEGTDGDFVVQKPYSGDPPRTLAIATWIVGNVYTDGCQWEGSLLNPPLGPSVDDLANALSGLEDRETTVPVDVVLDGFAGKELEMTIPDIDFATCDNSEFRSWVDPTGIPRFHQGPLEHSRILILDVDGTRVLIFGRNFPASSAADVAALNQLIDTIQIEVVERPTAAPLASP
jgi:hypothetical protein